MNNFKLLLSSLFVLFTCSAALGQGATIVGIVNDGNYPLPGASVMLSGTTKGVNTDFDGNFVLSNVKKGEVTLEISYIGFETKRVSINTNVKKNVGVIMLVPSNQNLEEVIITSSGRRNSEARALSIQKKSMSIMNVIAADGIGKLPDRNAAETVQRIQGLSIERDQGEGRFVSVRGLPPFWASTTINGNRIPTAEEETTSRATAFDFFPSELISYVQAAKAYTPDMEADGIGGGVNFITQTAPAKRVLNVNVGGGYNEKSGEPIYNASLTYGDRSKDGKFGFIVNGSYWNRNWGTDNFEARRKGDEGVFRMELRDYNGVRITKGLNGAMEYNFTPEHKMHFRGVYGTLSDTETHYKHRVRFDKFDSGTNTARVELQNIYNELITEMIGGEIGGRHITGNGKFDWSIANYNNEFRYGGIPTEQDKSYYVVKFKQDGVGMKPEYLQNRPEADGGAGDDRAYWKADGGLLDYNDTDALFGFFSDPSFKMDASQMSFADLELYKISIKERDNIVASLNYEHTFNDNFKIKVGTKFRDKDRRAKFEDVYYGWDEVNAGITPNLSDYSQNIIEQPGRADFLNEMGSNIQSTFGPVLSEQGMVNFWKNNKNNLIVLEGDSEILQNGGGLGRNFNVDETHLSFYGMGTLKLSDQFTVLGGLRATKTETEVNGYVWDADQSQLNAVRNVKDYWAVLPMLHVKYSPKTDLNIRFAATRSFSRPNFGDIAPGGTFISFDNEFKGGNPNLNPTFSWNFDLLGEYYFKNVGVINAGIFYKSITDPVFNDTYQGTYNGNTGVEFSTPVNGADAWIGGIELGINKRFDFLPGFLQYFGTQLNATFMDSEMTKPSGRKVSIAYQANTLFNAQLFFEKGGFNTRLAYNHKGSYAIGFGERDIDDIYYGKYNTLDFSASYQIGKNWTIFTDVNNLLNNPLIYHYGKTEDRPKQVEFYGIKGSIGVKYNL
ncbi:TonB-dependent receptor [Tenacibaculum sp. XPcli2-G]|uniref:TonB-dependent receptor n=1 Tax=Tenacibaculum sp. XPcli2-G TaxID=2954503 RepID=UPI002097F283|nr:TonB-dependent receptor [Tenacibaculum sp. XPcli2-G]MCO7185988.1 TonB-dependent receptor [Tenacibaculum sp. XPcli2-G]